MRKQRTELETKTLTNYEMTFMGKLRTFETVILTKHPRSSDWMISLEEIRRLRKIVEEQDEKES